MTDRVALITGAARGNGLAIAKALAGAGATVYMADLEAPLPEVPYPLSGRQILESAAEELRRAGEAGQPRVHTLICDVRDPAAVDGAVSAVEAEQGRLDILVNNAGVLVLNRIQEAPDSDWDVQMDIIAKGTFLCCRRVISGMNARGWGRIVNISSVSGHLGLGLGVAYAAAKHAVIGITRSLAMEVARQGVTVNAVCPGSVDTALVRGTAEAMGLPLAEAMERFSARHLTGRPLTSEDVAAAVAWLVSDGAARVNGTSLFVDDGWSAH